jgi:hypothetical protein
MADLLSFEAGIAEVLGAVAVLVAVFLWRTGNTNTLVAEIIALRVDLARGDPRPRVRHRYIKANVRAVVQVLALVSCAHALYDTYRYLSTIDYVSANRFLDTSILQTLIERIELLRIHCISVICVSVLCLAIDWAGELLMQERLPRWSRKLPRAYVLPPLWRTAPEALWEWRITRLSGRIAASDSDDWKAKWIAWASAVSIYEQIAAQEEMASTDDRVDVAWSTLI